MSRPFSLRTIDDASINTALAAGFFVLAALHGFALPWLIEQDPLAAWLLLVAVLASNTHWALIHEAIHGSLYADKRLARYVGRALAVVWGASFDLLRWGHLLHHVHSRTRRERSEVHAGSKPTLGFTLAYYVRILGGLYCAEVLASLLMLLPKRWLHLLAHRLSSQDNVIEALAQRLLDPATLAALRADAGLLLLWHGVALWGYGEHASLYLASLAGRALLISLVDNVFHYGTELDAPRRAMNLKLSPLASLLCLHFNLHGVHHWRPGVPWRRLPQVFAETKATYHDDWWPALLRQLRGPLAEETLAHGARRCG
ncbi:MAG: fatty acid desaturase [Rhodocyclaceae bacterium]|nr:fatty acid desaturase [Rhodocyclaceae bacterium]